VYGRRPMGVMNSVGIVAAETNVTRETYYVTPPDPLDM
jgi:hypothetical protein